MRVHPYSTEYIQAEIDFAAIDLQTPSSIAGYLATESETLATNTAPEGVTRTYVESRDDRGETLQQYMSQSAYQNVLHNLKATGYGRKALQCAADARRRYESFKPEIEEMRHYIEEGTAHELGSGNESTAYMFTKEKQRYVATVPHDHVPSFLSEQVYTPTEYGGPEAYVAFKTAEIACTMACAHGIEGARQLTAYSPKDGLCITEYSPGRPVHDLSPDEIAKMTPNDMARYVRTVGELAGRGLIVDYGEATGNPTNILWHKQHSFTVIDCRRRPAMCADIDGAVKIMAKALLCKAGSFGSNDGPTLCPEKSEAALPIVRELDALARERLQSGVDYIRLLEAKDEDGIREFLRT